MAKKKKIEEKIEKTSLKSNSIVKLFSDNKIVLGFILIIAAIIVIALLMVHYSNNFKYNGIDFKKINYGQIRLYTATIPVKDYYGNVLEYRTVDFRNDPRKLSDKVNIADNLVIKFLDEEMTYLAFKDDQVNCENYGLATANLAIFMRDVIKIEYKAALVNQTQANEKNVSHVSCESNPFNTVIYLHQGNETKITKRLLGCYDVQFKDCEILEAAEAFELKILEQYMNSLS